MKPRVAVIDVGSNSIKVLVAESSGDSLGLHPVFQENLEVRISHGIAGDPPELQPDRIEAGVKAIQRLWNDCQDYGPISQLRIVATSAVRTAANGHVFMSAVEQATGIAPEILTGSEEAEGIAYGVRTDPAIADELVDFTVFDLGGGSLELIRFEHHGVTDRTSLPLGSVRMTEQFVTLADEPLSLPEREAIREHVRSHIIASAVPIKAPLVGCSGGLSAVRHVLAKQSGKLFELVSPEIKKSYLKKLTDTVLRQNLHDRIEITRLPPSRADIFPAALITFQVLMELAGARRIQHSLHNLRYGLAWQMLKDQVS
jgi:exopolyphosphatase/guanosine-5'-triphosphate,3'-diphosphate pyrophosphatase